MILAPKYCSECGQPVGGKFCSQCGARLTVDDEPIGDWSDEARFDVLMRVPKVRDLIQRHANRAKKGLTGEQILGLFDKVVPLGVPMEKVAAIIQPIYASWGIQTGKQDVHVLAVPVGKATVRILCSLARNGQAIRDVKQGTDGCAIEAELPSDIWSLAGQILVTTGRVGTMTEVTAATTIPGQYFDWGKSRRCLERLFADLQVDPT